HQWRHAVCLNLSVYFLLRGDLSLPDCARAVKGSPAAVREAVLREFLFRASSERVPSEFRASASWLVRKEVVMSKHVRSGDTQLLELGAPLPCAGPACRDLAMLALIEPQEDLPGYWRLCPLCLDCIETLFQAEQAMRRGACLAISLAATAPI